MKACVWIGFDPREQIAFDVAVASLRVHSGFEVEAYAVHLARLQEMGLYQRTTTKIDGLLWDIISDAPMSTEFAISRFFVPTLCNGKYDWAVFLDCDMMFRAPVEELLALADPRKAVQVVKHCHVPAAGTKMDGQRQTAYPRKNWSSVILWNLRHPANRTLTVAKLNTWTGRALHGFQWLEDEFIGELPPEWNHLVGVKAENPDAKLVHFTLGIPSMDGYATCEHSAEWWKYARGQCPQPAQLN